MNSNSQNGPFLIIGSGRSGTTMLRLMLNEHPRLSVGGESGFITTLMEQLPLDLPLSQDDKHLAFDIISNHWRWKNFYLVSNQIVNSNLLEDPRIQQTLPNEKLLDVISSLEQPLLCELIDAVFCNFANPDKKPRWGDKTPQYVKEVNKLHKVFYDAKFIHLIRDGRDVYISLRNLGWAGSTIKQKAQHWCKAVNMACEVGRELDDELYLEITYEDLVLKTEETLKTICTFLGEEYDSRMLNFHKGATKKCIDLPYHLKTRRPPDPADTYRWRKEMSLMDVALFEAYAGITMDLVGQTRHFQGPVRLIFPSLRAVGNLNKKFRRIFIPTKKDRELLTLTDSAYFLYYLLRPIRLLGKYTLTVWKRLLSN